jgi:hypothetical protein
MVRTVGVRVNCQGLINRLKAILTLRASSAAPLVVKCCAFDRTWEVRSNFRARHIRKNPAEAGPFPQRDMHPTSSGWMAGVEIRSKMDSTARPEGLIKIA